jgi:hypothetical protein
VNINEKKNEKLKHAKHFVTGIQRCITHIIQKKWNEQEQMKKQVKVQFFIIQHSRHNESGPVSKYQTSVTSMNNLVQVQSTKCVKKMYQRANGEGDELSEMAGKRKSYSEQGNVQG